MRDLDCPQCGGQETLEGRALNMGRSTVTYVCKNQNCLYEEEHPV